MDRVLGAAERLGDVVPADEAERLERVDLLCRDGGALRRSLQDVLDLSELEAGKLLVADSEYSPRELAREALEAARSRHAHRNLALELECASGLPATVRGDSGRVRQILGRLLEHAIESTPDHGSVRLLVRAPAALGRPDGLLQFEVVDSGVGLTRDQEGLVFEPFGDDGGRGHPPETRLRLGLPVSKRVAQHLGGDLTIERAEGPGCRFVLTVRAVGTAGAGLRPRA
jgi:signal transduction histidine kinase